MAKTESILTASTIKYLTVLWKLNKNGKGIRSVDVSEYLDVAKSTVHGMMEILTDKKMVQKTAYGLIYFTSYGKKTAKKYAGYHDRLNSCFSGIIEDPEECRSVVFALLPEISGKSIAALEARRTT